MSAKKNNKVQKSEPAMRITAARRKEIARLSEALAAIAPTTTRGKSFCVQHIAENMGLKHCWRKQQNKKADLEFLLVNTIRQYPRKPRGLVLAVVEGGVQWMARKGKQVTQEHFDAIAEPMLALGFDIRKALKAIDIPDASRVSTPSPDVSALFDRLEIHGDLLDDVAEMFRDGHFNEAVRKALERFEKKIQNTIGDHKISGQGLMAKTFSEERPLIALNEGKSDNDTSEQAGFKFLTMGAMSGMRNIYSHGDVDQMSAMDAIERLGFVSLLFKRVDEASS